MFENILIPVALAPGNDSSRPIFAARLLLSEGGALTLLHVLERLPHYIEPELPAGLIEKSHAQAQVELDKITQHAGGGATAVMAEGHSGRTIVHVAERMEADCIVMGSHKPALGDYLVGSTSAYIERHAKCSVLVIR